MTLGTRRSQVTTVLLDRALEVLPVFRLSDSADDRALQYAPESGGRWRVLPAPGDRLPGTFDQDVYVELLHRFHEADCPDDGALTFTLHSFLRTMGRKADGRTYEQLRAALSRLERTTLESTDAWYSAASGAPATLSFAILSAVTIERRRNGDREQLALFPSLTANEPGDARVVLSPPVRANIAAQYITTLSWTRYQQLTSPVARRLYRLLAGLRSESGGKWRVPLDRWAEQLPLSQRYPSHLQRVLQPAHEMLVASGVVKSAIFKQEGKEWWVEYAIK